MNESSNNMINGGSLPPMAFVGIRLIDVGTWSKWKTIKVLSIPVCRYRVIQINMIHRIVHIRMNKRINSHRFYFDKKLFEKIEKAESINALYCILSQNGKEYSVLQCHNNVLKR